ncbi:MAG: polymer-forming cytoskeletal protein [Acidobacteriaceae bacterium]|nr:polymer-forming cytoskeletal protein [Acidobacteriaceae bacterium]
MGEATTVIGTTAHLRGELIATGDVVIEGQIDGTVHAEGARVTIGREARVRADISAQHVLVLGKVEGTLHASERVELRATASVVGDVVAKRFSMEEEAQLRGRVGSLSAVSESHVSETAAPVHETEAAYPPAPEPLPGLFGQAQGSRVAGQMPAGLAAAARSLGQNGGPSTGLNALSDEAESHEPGA